MIEKERCICSARLRRKMFSEHFDAMSCRACGSSRFVMATNSGTAALDFRYDGGNEKYAEKGYLYGKQLRWSHLELLKQDWSGRKVLEIGCFNGFFLDELRKHGANVYGFDVNPEAISVGENLFGLIGRLETSLDCLAGQGPFDDILCIDVMEHLDQPKELLDQLQTMLKPAGQVVIAGPTVERRFHDKSDFPPHHKWWFSRQGLHAFLQQSGFEVVTVSVQRDGMLFVRNFIGRMMTGLNNREFFGQTTIAAPSMGTHIQRVVYRLLSVMGTVVFTLLRLSYCSTIFTARKVCHL